MRIFLEIWYNIICLLFNFILKVVLGNALIIFLFIFIILFFVINVL